ncbi:MAG TPA: hypothetical protein DIW24_05405 [Bacteroidetes bacterium]|nr:hypothetical protein [Bacteroidota bacterium]HRR07919.1 hypothetical protein [Rhodothermales bacterium]
MLFLIDGIGALISTFLLAIVLKTFHGFFGVQEEVLNWLSALAFGFSLYSLACFGLLKNHFKPFLATIGIANILYCCLTIALIIFYCPNITFGGVVYFALEISILVLLVIWELTLAQKSYLSN